MAAMLGRAGETCGAAITAFDASEDCTGGAAATLGAVAAGGVIGNGGEVGRAATGFSTCDFWVGGTGTAMLGGAD
jgi:hypothetical protein